MSTAKRKTSPKKTTSKAIARSKKPATKAAATAKKPAPREDYGAPIDGFFARQSPEARKTLEALRTLVEKAAPEATASIKWGMPFYEIGGATLCALTAHKSHLNLVLSGPPGTFADPDGLLEGDGKTGRRLKLAPGGPVPTKQVSEWLKAAATRARAEAKG